MIKFCIVLTIYLTLVCGTLTPNNKNNKKATKTKEIKIKNGPDSVSVFDRNLIEDEPAARDILIENKAYYTDTADRHFNGTILGYVTPVSYIK
jgi:chitinase domain-containing protein 1